MRSIVHGLVGVMVEGNYDSDRAANKYVNMMH